MRTSLIFQVKEVQLKRSPDGLSEKLPGKLLGEFRPKDLPTRADRRRPADLILTGANSGPNLALRTCPGPSE